MFVCRVHWICMYVAFSSASSWFCNLAQYLEWDRLLSSFFWGFFWGVGGGWADEGNQSQRERKRQKQDSRKRKINSWSRLMGETNLNPIRSFLWSSLLLFCLWSPHHPFNQILSLYFFVMIANQIFRPKPWAALTIFCYPAWRNQANSGK